MNRIEDYKREKDGLAALADLPRYAREGWETIDDGDKERLKWLGVFFRRQTPGSFMMRLRFTHGVSNSAQFRVIADLSRDFGKDFVDLTTRQQLQLRWFGIDQVAEIWRRLAAVDLVSLQTGMDNIRGVVGCPVAGLTPNELFDAGPAARAYTAAFLGNREYTNLPRKFNVVITACLDQCCHSLTQDIALTPAVQAGEDAAVKGFNVAVGGKQGSGGFHPAEPLDVFVPPELAAPLCSSITLLYRDYGPREARNKARLSFLLEDWGVARFRRELEKRAGYRLPPAGIAAELPAEAIPHPADHLGIHPQRQPGLNYAGLAAPVGRITGGQLRETARLAEEYGNGEIRLTIGQNLIIPNLPDALLPAFRQEPLLRELRPDPSPAMRGLVSCTGIDYCHFAQVDTKELALQTARDWENRLQQAGVATPSWTVHWSGCPNACGNHAVADLGILGKKARIDGQIVAAADIFRNGRLGDSGAAAPVKIRENVPCEQLPAELAKLAGELGG